MRSRILSRTFLTLAVLLSVMALASVWLVGRLLDEHALALVENERLILKTTVINGLSQAGLLSPEEAPPPPGAGQAQPGASGRTSARVVAAVRKAVSNYRLGQGGYAWVFDTARQDFTLLRLDVAGVAPAMVQSDRDQVPGLLATHAGDGAITLSNRFVAFTPLQQFPQLILGITYPRAEVAPMVSAWRDEALLLLVVLLVVGLVVLHRIARDNDEGVGRLVKLAEAAMRRDEEVPETVPLPDELQPVGNVLVRLWRDFEEGKARDVDPLTNLPGRNALSAELFRRIDLGVPLAVGLVDATDFNAYNYKYGYARGDSFLRFMGTLVHSTVREYGGKDDFVARVDADHFAFVTAPERAEAVSGRLVHAFDQQVGFYYDKEDRERGHILSKDRRGDFRTFPMMHLTVGIATNERHPLLHPLQIAHICGEVVAYLKRAGKSGFLRDRRVEDREELPRGEGQEPAEEKTSGQSEVSTPVEGGSGGIVAQ